MSLDAFLASALVKSAAEPALIGRDSPDVLTRPAPPPLETKPELVGTPTDPNGTAATALGIGVPWKGAVAGGLGLAAWNYLRAKKDKGRAAFNGAITGALGGAGTQLGMNVGGELARRHAVHGGSAAATASTAIGGTAAGAGAGLGAAYLLHKLLAPKDDGEE
jgi:hypothetical protein